MLGLHEMARKTYVVTLNHRFIPPSPELVNDLALRCLAFLCGLASSERVSGFCLGKLYLRILLDRAEGCREAAEAEDRLQLFLGSQEVDRLTTVIGDRTPPPRIRRSDPRDD